MKKQIIEWLISIVSAVGISVIITSFITVTEVYSISMEPTLVEHDRVVLVKTNNVNHNDIVVIETNLKLSDSDLQKLSLLQRLLVGEAKTLIKRVIAVEGDQLVIENGKVFVNGYELKEDYINGTETHGNIKIDRIPENKVFVMGDNRDNSLDSRSSSLGLVETKDIVGKVIFRVYPFSKFGNLR